MSALPVRIGTAGWNVPSRYAERMPRSGSHLQRYAGRLNAVEINSSFYRPHRRTTYERWAQATPADFRFSVKVPKTITHAAQLKDCSALLDRFVTEVTGLGNKLCVLLVQLPPPFRLDKQVAGPFFRELRERIDTPTVVEPRHASWFEPDVEDWLADLLIARAATDPAPVAGAREAGGSKELAYYRWHGSPQIYFSDYDAAALSSLKKKLDESHQRNVPTWCIFDNTARGAALGNALALSSSFEAPGV